MGRTKWLLFFIECHSWNGPRNSRLTLHFTNEETEAQSKDMIFPMIIFKSGRTESSTQPLGPCFFSSLAGSLRTPGEVPGTQPALKQH